MEDGPDGRWGCLLRLQGGDGCDKWFNMSHQCTIFKKRSLYTRLFEVLKWYGYYDLIRAPCAYIAIWQREAKDADGTYTLVEKVECLWIVTIYLHVTYWMVHKSNIIRHYFQIFLNPYFVFLEWTTSWVLVRARVPVLAGQLSPKSINQLHYTAPFF
jgi:hypothetical protein